MEHRIILLVWIASVPGVLAQITSPSAVVDGGGNFSTNVTYQHFSAIGQGGPVGFNDSAANINYSGFLNTFLLAPDQDSIHPFTTTTPVGYYDGTQASPIGPDMANGYGLYDMAGNVSEWCWDWKSNEWYTNQAASVNDTTGPANGEFRVLRGGDWSGHPLELHCANRRQSRPAGSSMWGFRAARRP